MPKLSEIAGLDEAVQVDFSNLPDQFSIRNPLPQPGAGYVFRFPTISPDDDNWIADLTNDSKVPRIGYSFSDGKELILLAAPGGPNAENLGMPVRWRLTNIERKFGDDDKSPVSPMAHMLAHSFKLDLTGKTNKSYIQALIAISGRAFGAGVNWTGYCNKERDIYVPADEETGQEGGQIAGHKGCGTRYALKQRKNKKTGELTLAIPRGEDGKFQERFLCAGMVQGVQCPALVSCFLDLQNFQPSPDEFKHLKASQVVTSAPIEVPGNGKGEAATTPEQAEKKSSKPAQTASAKQQA